MKARAKCLLSFSALAALLLLASCAKSGSASPGDGGDGGGGGGSSTVATPTFSPAGGTYGSTQSVTITTATAGATICYRTDGTDPSAPTPGTCGAGSTTYSGPVNVSSTSTLKAIGTKSDMTNSSVASATYTIDTTAPTVSSTTPADAATGIARNTTIQVVFSEAMNTSTISTTTSTTCTGSLQVSADSFTTCVAMTSATPTASGGNTTFTMTPAANLASAATYKIRVTTAAQDVAGNGLTSAYETSTGFTTRYSKTITIDGTNDFSASETFATSSGGYTAYLTWDENYVYLGMQGADVNSGSSTKWVLAYFNGSGGSTSGLTYNTQQPNMPTGFSAKYHLRWKADDSYTNAQSFGTGWTDAGWSFTGSVFRSGNFVEFRIARSDIGNPTTLGIIVNMINEQPMSEGSYAVAPSSSFTDGYDPNYTKYFSCGINTSNVPTTACSVVP